MTKLGGPTHDSGLSFEDDTLSDRTARLAIEAGPGHGFYKAIIDMANTDTDPHGEHDEPALAPEADVAAEGENDVERVGVDDLAFAAKEMKIKRLVVVTPFGDSASMTTVLSLSRLLSEENNTVALLQLDEEAESPLAVDGEDGRGAGWIDLLGGARDVSDIIHRDPESRLQVTPSGGVDLEALDEDQLGDLSFYLKAFDEAYATTVIHAPIASLGRISELSRGETAIIVAAPTQQWREVAKMAHDLNPSSNYDVLHLLAETETRILH